MCKLLALLLTKYCHTLFLEWPDPILRASSWNWLRIDSFSSSGNRAGTMPRNVHSPSITIVCAKWAIQYVKAAAEECFYLRWACCLWVPKSPPQPRGHQWRETLSSYFQSLASNTMLSGHPGNLIHCTLCLVLSQKPETEDYIILCESMCNIKNAGDKNDFNS